jgi:hypothetical protein
MKNFDSKKLQEALLSRSQDNIPTSCETQQEPVNILIQKSMNGPQRQFGKMQMSSASSESKQTFLAKL